MTLALSGFLLLAGVLVQLFCCAGVCRMRTPLDRLHYLAPASFLGPLLIASSIAVAHSSMQLALKALATALVLALSGPLITRVLARAVRIRETGTADPLPEEVLPTAMLPGGQA